MKLDDHIKSKPDTELSIKKKQFKEKFLFVGTLKPKPNQRVFKLDLSKMEISECEYFSKDKTVNYLDVVSNSSRTKERSILIEEGFDYIIKLNIKNALNYFSDKYPKETISLSSSNSPQKQMKDSRKVNKYKNK